MPRSFTLASRGKGRISALLALLAAPAWLLLVLASGNWALPALCSSALLWSVPTPETYNFFFAFVPVQDLAVGWALMVVAMMLPTLTETLGHVWQRSFSDVRALVVALVVVGYGAVWMAAGVALLGLALTLRLAAPSGPVLFLIGLATAALWQVSGWKQRALNRCHRRPVLAAFTPALFHDALRLGLEQGLACLANCWALMLMSLLAPSSHILVMAVVALWIWIERIEPPSPPVWGVRAPRRTLRLLAHHLSRPIMRPGPALD